MSNDIFHKDKQNYENVEIPEELDFVVRKTLKQAKRKQYKKIIYKPLIAVVATITVFIISVNISPTIAQAISNIPGLSRLVQLVTFDKGFDNAISEGLAQEINWVGEENGVKLKVTTAVGDWQRLWVGHEIDGVENYNVEVEVVHNNENIPCGIQFGNLHGKREDYITIFFKEFWEEFTLRYKVYKVNSESMGMEIENNSEYKEPEYIAIFNVPIKLDSAIFNSELREVELAKNTLETSVGNIKIKRLETSKTRIGIYLELESDKYDFMSFENPRLIDDKGNIYEISSSYISGTDEDGVYRIELQGEIKGDIKSLELQFDGLYYGPKEENIITIDLKNKVVKPNYYGISMESINGSNIVLVGEGIKNISVNDVLDNNGETVLSCNGISSYEDQVKIYLSLNNYENDEIDVDVFWILKDKAEGGTLKLIEK